MGDKYAKKPLLYIHQASTPFPKAKMQQSYATPKKERPPTNEAYHNQKYVRLNHRRRNFYSKEFYNNNDQPKKDNEQFVSSNKKKFNKFKDLTIQEKIYYLLNKPEQMPKIKCEIEASDKTYHGVVISETDESITIRIGKKKMNIEKEHILNIRIIGF